MFESVSLPFFVLLSSLAQLIHYESVQMREKDLAGAMRELARLPTRETFDFIIVGGGTAGSVLARRLSDRYRVLVLEAGGDPAMEEEYVPSLTDFMMFFTDINWLYNSTRQERFMQENGGYFVTSGGKMLGGSGSHNRLQYERGSPHGYDMWANITGDASWRYENVLKYFLRSENYRGNHSLASGHHRVGGFVDVSSSSVPFREDIWFSAAEELGFPTRIDPNGPQRIGFAAAEYNTRRGHRVSAYDGYMRPVRSRRNLLIRRYSVASKVIVEQMKATGVEYYRHGVLRTAYASKEVILSAGAFISPLLLMKSGIGPRDQLDLLGVKQLADLPVGQSLMDHIFVRLPPIAVNDSSVFTYSLANVTYEDFDEFRARGTGFLAAFDARHEAFIASNRAKRDGEGDWADIQLYLQTIFVNGTDYLACNVNLNREKSHGRLVVNASATTLEDRLCPLVDYNFLAEPTDRDVLLEGIEMCQRIVATQTFRRFGARFLEDTLPACNHLPFGTADYWKCYIEQRAMGNNHVTATCSMGAADSAEAVVDSKLRVRGIQSLRVVDASVIPRVPNANMNAAVMMIAEKTADEITLSWH